jgi:aspartyl-tRNA(Asn)/glutamyl-tRNA(Gln) amidotransferase subunit B
MRSKEGSPDYRYFPDPDLLPVRFPRDRVEELRAGLPEGVFDRQRRYERDYALPYSLTSVICYDHQLARFFEEAMEAYNRNPKALANYVANELQRERSRAEGDGLLPMEKVRLKPAELAAMVRLIDEGKLSKQGAKEAFVDMFQSGQPAGEVVDRLGLLVEPQDHGELEKWCREAVEADPATAAQVREGNEKAINRFMGPVMKASGGKANPGEVRKTLVRLIGESG